MKRNIANEIYKNAKSIGQEQVAAFPRPGLSNGLLSDVRKGRKADVFTALAEDMLYKTRGPTKKPQKIADRTCLRKFAMKMLQAHDPKKAEKLLQEALAELGRLAEDHKVRNPMAIFVDKVKYNEFGG